MRPIATVLFDESHRQAWSTRPEVATAMNPGDPADAGYVRAAGALSRAGFVTRVHTEGVLDGTALAGVDVLVLPHCSDDRWEATTGSGSPLYTQAEISAIDGFVRSGGGLVILAETEQDKYGNSLAQIAAAFGVQIRNATVADPVHRHHEVSTWVLGSAGPASPWDVLAGVDAVCFYRAGALDLQPPPGDSGVVFVQASPKANPPGAGLLVGVLAGAGRVVVAADSDLFGDDSITELGHERLWRNLVTWAAAGLPRSPARAAAPSPALADPAWSQLVAAVEGLRPITAKDGSIPAADHPTAAGLVEAVKAALLALAPHFPAQAEQLAASARDFDKWVASGFAVPDFLDSLLLFGPQANRADGVEHLSVFPMYTQNGNPNRNVEAVICRTVWPDWVAALEANEYDNPAFVPIEFVGFTAGYDTHSAVLFPETVATRETPRFTWGAIFCDREAARFRRVSAAASEILALALPPDAEMLLHDQQLAQQTYILWDLVHDRTHSHGDLPFDPFMIKQRMPYWMYGLEELRCDLSTYRETARLEASGVTLARHVRYAILFDRLFRFPTTGERVRNYDGLGGQVLFAWLYQHDVLTWRDNTLRVDWPRLDPAVVELCEQVEDLYHRGISRSRMGHWLAAHEFVNSLVPAAPGSVWARGAAALPTEPKLAVDAVLPDEFPLNVFYEALRKKLAPTIAATRGITGADA